MKTIERHSFIVLIASIATATHLMACATTEEEGTGESTNNFTEAESGGGRSDAPRARVDGGSSADPYGSCWSPSEGVSAATRMAYDHLPIDPTDEVSALKFCHNAFAMVESGYARHLALKCQKLAIEFVPRIVLPAFDEMDRAMHQSTSHSFAVAQVMSQIAGDRMFGDTKVCPTPAAQAACKEAPVRFRESCVSVASQMKENFQAAFVSCLGRPETDLEQLPSAIMICVSDIE